MALNFAEVSKIVRSFPGAKLADVCDMVRRAGHRVECTADHPEAWFDESRSDWTRWEDLSPKTLSLIADRHAYTLAVKFVEDFRARARLAFDVRVGSIGRITGGKYAAGRYEVTRIDFDKAAAVVTRFGVTTPVVVEMGPAGRGLSAKSAGAVSYAEQRLITAKRIIPTGLPEPEEELPLEFVDGKLMEVHPDGSMTEAVLTDGPVVKYDDIRPGMPLGALAGWEPNVRGIFDTFTDCNTINALMAGAAVRDCYGFALSLIADRIEELGMLPTEALRRTGADFMGFVNHVRKLATKPKYTAAIAKRWNR